jgi:hypothetical protein
MAVNENCRHYVMQTVRAGDKIERCRVGANGTLPFSCPEGCLFFEPRRVSQAGWHIGGKGPRGAGSEESG